MVLVRPSLIVKTRENVNGVVVLTMERDLIEEGVCPLKNEIDSLVGQGVTSILIDLQHVSAMDSSDVGRLIRAHISLRRNGQKIHLCNLLPRVAAVLSMTRLNTVFVIHKSRAEALRRPAY